MTLNQSQFYVHQDRVSRFVGICPHLSLHMNINEDAREIFVTDYGYYLFLPFLIKYIMWTFNPIMYGPRYYMGFLTFVSKL